MKKMTSTQNNKQIFTNFAFDTESNKKFGGGHISRCLSLAHQLNDKGRCIFILDEYSDYWSEKIIAQGHKISSRKAIKNTDLVIIDRYDNFEEVLNFWNSKNVDIAAFDDIGNRVSDKLKLVISPSLAPTNNKNQLSGPKYAIVSPVYAAETKIRPEKQSKTILVVFGLIDRQNGTEKVVDAFQKILRSSPGHVLKIVCGRDFPHLKSIQTRCGELGNNCELLIQPDNMIVLYDNADIVVGSGGVSMFERFARERPSITLSLADNQRSASIYSHEFGATIYVGEVASVTTNEISDALELLITDATLRVDISSKARKMVDGLGSSRVADALFRMAHKNQNPDEKCSFR